MEDLRDRLRAILAREAPLAAPRASQPLCVEPPLEALLPGRWERVGESRCFVSQHRYALDYRHGIQRLSDLAAAPASVWQPFVVGAEGEPFDPRAAAFIDTETTGLSRAAGTYCFLVGLGSFEGNAFVVRQYFMPDFGEEEALLELVAQEISPRAGLVSFNGRGFDWPLLEMRYLLARRPAPHRGEPHLDLLHASRRLWRRRLPSCALSALETELLGIQREELDVPGALIPQLYLDYVERGRTRPMAQVFYHNAMDVLSMVALAARVGAVVAHPFGEREAQDYVALGRLYLHQGDYQRAETAFRAVETDDGGEKAEARQELSFLLKRLGRLDEAMDIWWEEIEGLALYPYVELAKQFEHRLGDYEQARHLVARAIERVAAGQLPCRDPEAALRELHHRQARLNARLRTYSGEMPSAH